MDEIVALCKRRGFIFPSSEIYGGLGSTYDYGHYGVLLKTNVKAEWWRSMLQERDDIVALDSAILQHPRVWEASGHLDGFTDPLVDCRTCKQRFRADKLEDGRCGQKPSKLPGEGPDCDLTEARQFNLMFETHDRPGDGRGRSRSTCAPRRRRGSSSTSRTSSSSRASKPPFGIAQVGKSFRNEITPGNFIFRTREFEQMEMEFFMPPDRGRALVRDLDRAAAQVVPGARDPTRPPPGPRPMTPTSSPTTPRRTSDIEYLFPIGWSELEGIANRGDFDLTRHAEFSGEKLEYFDQEIEGALRPPRDRAGRRRRPRHPRLPGRRL